MLSMNCGWLRPTPQASVQPARRPYIWQVAHCCSAWGGIKHPAKSSAVVLGCQSKPFKAFCRAIFWKGHIMYINVDCFVRSAITSGDQTERVYERYGGCFHQLGFRKHQPCWLLHSGAEWAKCRWHVQRCDRVRPPAIQTSRLIQSVLSLGSCCTLCYTV